VLKFDIKSVKPQQIIFTFYLKINLKLVKNLLEQSHFSPAICSVLSAKHDMLGDIKHSHYEGRYEEDECETAFWRHWPRRTGHFHDRIEFCDVHSAVLGGSSSHYWNFFHVL
jgi:hypothetical protein